MNDVGAKRRKVVILGSTGSIGTSALKVARQIPERMEVVGLAAGRRVEELAAQAREFVGCSRLFDREAVVVRCGVCERCGEVKTTAH